MKLASFMENPTSLHWEAVKRVARYLKGTREMGITFRKGGGSLVGFTDADWASDQQDRISVSGHVFLFCGGPVSWSSRKQRSVALSSMEAEYNAATSASTEAVWLRRFVNEVGPSFGLHIPTIPLYVDNESAIKFISNDVAHNRTKHIDTKHHYIRNLVTDNILTLHFIRGTENPADIFTKALGPSKHIVALRLLGLHD